MLRTALELLAGFIVIILTLRDVLDTVVVPGASHGFIRVAHRTVRLVFPIWKLLSRRSSGKRRFPRAFAPFVLVASVLTWTLLLLFGFGLMTDGLRNGFDPPLQGFTDALYVVGSAMTTMGLSGLKAIGPARWVVLAAGFCGLAVITLTITYMLEVQNGVRERETRIVELGSVAGNPPSGLTLLENYAKLGCRHELPGFFRNWRSWAASVLHSHSAHPVLAFFRSVGADTDWPVALTAVLDAAAFIEVLDDEASATAKLFRSEGLRLATRIADLFDLHPRQNGSDRAALESAERRLKAAGFSVGPDFAGRVATLREQHLGLTRVIAEHLGADPDAISRL